MKVLTASVCVCACAKESECRAKHTLLESTSRTVSAVTDLKSYSRSLNDAAFDYLDTERVNEAPPDKYFHHQYMI